MSRATDPQRQAVLERAAAALPQEAGCFMQLFYAGAPAADLDYLGAEELTAGAASIWSFAEQRAPGEHKLRAFTGGPDGDAPWCSAPLALEVVSDDMPFLIASLSGLMERLSLTVELLLHPVIAVNRDAEGRRSCLGGGKSESMIQIRLSGLIAPAQLEAETRKVLADVRAATSDWRQMLHRLSVVTAELDDPALTDAGVPDADVHEAKAFLHWMADNHFTLLGYREYRFEQTPAGARMSVAQGSGLGVLRDPDVQVFEGARNLWELPAEVRAFLEAKNLLVVHKADRRSTVHRNVHMDVIGVKRLDADGKVIAEHRFVGLFTSSAYNQPPQTIPLLRRKVEAVIAASGLNPNSHDGKALLQILETYPRDELFAIEPKELSDVALGVLAVQERRRIALFVRKDPFGRFVSCLVYVPRDRYDFELREKFHRILTEAWDGTISASFLLMGDAPLARMRVIIKTKRGQAPDVDVAALERRLIDTGRSWRDHLAAAARRAGLKDTEVLARYGAAFGPGYAERFDVDDAIADIPRIEAATTERPICWLHRHADARPAELNVRLYRAGAPILLSDVLPMLENRGLRVLTEAEYRVCAADLPQPVWLHDFQVECLDGPVRDLVAAGERFRDGFLAAWTGEAEEDGFNRLILAAGLNWRDAAIFRAYAKYLKQVGFPYSQSFLEQTLARHGGIAAKLAALFHAKFTPDSADQPDQEPKARAARVKALTAEIEQKLDAVSALDEDKALRRFLNLIQATLRANVFQPGADGGPKPYVAFKLNSRQVEDLPKPRPHVEVWVYSPRVEAIHLRGGPAARGGIRWSDRREDFRTEILGLMKAQMVKNAVIVPVGSKGGFVVKRPPDAAAGRAALQAEVIACYKTLMFGLLDLTDNRVGSAVVPPRSVVRYDGDDPYLVVAADKGTATFSDIANGVSRDYGFWLDDAFASGGSAGYDHKKLGITARGAWVAAQRHFREIGVDLDAAPVTVVGVGDMSGDVFGNGMLRSSAMKLVGAFNHLHIFLDPDPDPAAAYAERLRLFQTPGSAWSDYNAALISAGGGVWPRSAKTLPLSPQVQALLGLSVDHLSPPELIQALLRAPVDMIWFGGIGGYIKAESESHADVGDRANDAVRVDAKSLRAKVVAEGANLGVTQRGRLEFAAAGGRINTDAIDNSAGVDMSDHEVNIKILLADPEAKAALDRPARDALLAEMADEASELVLRDNFEQTLAISAAEKEGAELIEPALRLIAAAERQNGLDRALEALPADGALQARKTAGGGLLRPELAVLLAHAKILVYNALLANGLPDDPALSGDLAAYFPQALQTRFPGPLHRHGLRREITATALTNELVARGGICFATELAAETGADLAAVARAFVIARELLALPSLWAQIDAVTDPTRAAAQMEAHRAAGRIAAAAGRWLLTQHLAGPIEEAVATLAEPVSQLIERAPPAPGFSADLPPVLAERLARLTAAVKRLSVVGLARALHIDAAQAAEVYFAVAARFGFDLLGSLAAAAPTPDAWVKRAMRGVIDDAEKGCAKVAAAALSAGGLERWADTEIEAARRAERAAAELAAGPPTMARLIVAERELREAFAHV